MCDEMVQSTGTRPIDSSTRRGHIDVQTTARNKINRQRSRLRASFYQSKVDKIGESNSRQWWKTFKTMIGIQPSKSHLCDLADQLCGGDTLALANNINMVFNEVTSDLQPLLPTAASVDHDVPDEFIISVTDCEQKLSKLCVHKAMGPDNIPNWIITDLSYILASPIAAIYNSSVSTKLCAAIVEEVQGAGVVCRVLDDGSHSAQ